MSRGPVTALFVGGPEDGNLRALSERQEYVAVAEFSRQVYDAARYDLLRDAYTLTGPEIRTRHYRRQRIVLFGRALDVWAFEGLHGPALDEAAMRHLLSPVALGLIGGSR